MVRAGLPMKCRQNCEQSWINNKDAHMGAVSFSLDPNLVSALKEACKFSTLVETGTFKGDTAHTLNAEFDRIFTVELSEGLATQAKQRLKRFSNVSVCHESSVPFLSRLKDELRGEAKLYWLDAHWCVAEGTAGEQSQCPLLDELAAIGELNASSAILIDDARLFMTIPPAPHETTHWPSFDAIIKALFASSPIHKVMVLNDVIVFYPPVAEVSVVRFAREHGIDWLGVIHSNSQLRRELAEKDAILRQLSVTNALPKLNAISKAAMKARAAARATLRAIHVRP
jgi:hypothetical protein